MGKKVFQSYRKLNTKTEKFKEHNGKWYLSYSAYTSWREPAYKGAFFADKFLGIRDNGNIFTDFGGACGEYLETANMDVDLIQSELLTPSDLAVLDSVPIPENSEFEREILVDRGHYVITGYIDRATRTADQKVDVVDYKTGGEKKIPDYAGTDYNQTRLYSYALEQEGEEINYVGVELLLRKGNNLIPGDKNVLRLEGGITNIPTPYSRQETEFWLEGFDKVAEEISDYLTFYQKYFKD